MDNIKGLFNLKGKTALVTGGSQGIGRAISLALAEYETNIVIVYLSGKERAERTQLEIREMGVNCHLIQSDLSQPDSVELINNALNENGVQIDILILNASVQTRTTWEEVSYEEYQRHLDVNFGASLFLIQKLYPAMRQKKWGRIITIGSVQQIRPHKEMFIYAASKHAQLCLVKSLATQFGPDGVTINNIAPGAIRTARNEKFFSDQSYKEMLESKIPLGFIGEPYDCASLSLLLSSEAGRYITGQDIFVDGGLGLGF